MDKDVQQAVPVAQEVAIVAVTQADRDAVQAFHHVMLLRLMSDVKSQRPKLGDDEGDAGTLVQAFARHRLAATSLHDMQITPSLSHPCKSGEGAGFVIAEDLVEMVSKEYGQGYFCTPDAVRFPTSPDHSTREAEGENNLPACTTCGAPAGLDCRTGQGRIPPCYGREQPVRWRGRWYGSEPQKGSAIVDERGNLIAYFGGDKETHKATTAAVAAHNAALNARGGA